MSEFWESLKLTVAEIGGKILGVIITFATLAATIWALVCKLKQSQQEAARAKAEAALAVTNSKMEDAKGNADDLEKKYRDAADRYKSERDSSSSGGEGPTSPPVP